MRAVAPVDPYGLVGQVLDGQFRLDAPIGEGGFSVVYRGHHLGLDEPVAIKCLKLQGQLNTAMVDTFVQRFRDESKIQYKLSQGSLYIVRTIAAGTTMAPATMALVPYMVLEWLDGFTLAAELRARRMRGESGREFSVAIRMLDPVAEAMAVAHSMGVVHRDLNPSNIFVAAQPGGGGFKLKVMDFGVAKVVSDHALSMGKRAATLGQFRLFTPAYGAPEQFNEKLGAIGPWTDVYAFALLVSEVLTDRSPVDANDYPTLLSLVLDPNVRPTPRTLGAHVGDRVERVIAQALNVDPALRPTDIGEFWGMLKHASIQDEVGRSLPAPMPSAMVSFVPPPVGMFDVPSAPLGAPWSSSASATASDGSGSQPSMAAEAFGVTSAIGDLGDHDEPPPGTLRIPTQNPGGHRISVPPPTSPSNAPQVSSSNGPHDLAETSRKTKKGTFIMLDASEAQARIDSLIQRDISTGSSRPAGPSNDPRLPVIPPPPPMPHFAGESSLSTTQRSQLPGGAGSATATPIDTSYAPPVVVPNPNSFTPAPASYAEVSSGGAQQRRAEEVDDILVSPPTRSVPGWVFVVSALVLIGLVVLVVAKVAL